MMQVLCVGKLDIQFMVKFDLGYCTCVYIIVIFPGAIAVEADLFNEGTLDQFFTGTNCNGTESSLLDCEKSRFDGRYCPTAGVVCQGSVNVHTYRWSP